MTKKQALKIFIFLGIFLFLLRSVTYVIRMNGDVKDRFNGFYALEKNTVDTIIIGSSPVYPCYATPKLWGDTGIPGYLLSTNMQRPVGGYYLVREAMKTQSPRLWIFEMRMYTGREEDMMSNMSHTRGLTDNLKYSINRIQTINAMIPDWKERYTYYFDIIKYHSNWKTMVMPSQLRDWNYDYPDDLMGYVTETAVGPSDPVDYSEDTDRAPIEDLQEGYLRKLCQFLKDNDQQALFIVTPYLIDQETQEQFNTLTDIVNEYGYDFLNMNNYYDEIGIDFQKDYTDYGNHVNAAGGEKVTAFLEDYLLDHYDWTDHRGDDRYRAWDDAYSLYQTQLDEARKEIDRRYEAEEFTVLGEGE